MDDPVTGRAHHGTALLELGLALLIAVAAGYLALKMPDFVREGGIQEAQDYVHLSSVFFPRLSFALTSIFAAILVIRSWKALPPPSAWRVSLAGYRYVRITVMGGVIVVYGMLIPGLGYGIATALAVGATAFYLGLRNWLALLAFSLATPVVTRFVFERLLSISLPLPANETLALLEQSLMRLLFNLLVGNR